MRSSSLPISRVLWGTNPRAPVYRRIKAQIRDTDEQLFAQPTWSVRSLLPKTDDPDASEITREKLHHLLKLSALPNPKTEEDEQRMLKTLQSQVHFVKEVQNINTKDVEPLVAIRDETHAAIQERTVTLQSLQPFLDAEEKVGINGTVRRKKDEGALDVEFENEVRRPGRQLDFDPFTLGARPEDRTKGRFFFVTRRPDEK